MTSFLERYQQGECEPVWADLLVLGEQVRREPLWSDAVAVARETMTRVRSNLELLLPRLEAAGYAFGYGWVQRQQAQALWSPLRTRLAQVLLHPLLARPPRADAWTALWPPPLTSPAPEVLEDLAEIERLAGVLPLSLRIFCEVVGEVNLVGTVPATWQAGKTRDPDWNRSFDPLVIFSARALLEDCRAWYEWRRTQEAEDEAETAHWQGKEEEEEEGTACHLTLAPDFNMKYGVSGGTYGINLPNAAIDAPFLGEWHETTFVQYLRICLRRAGLPGLDYFEHEGKEELHALKKGLLPI